MFFLGQIVRLLYITCGKDVRHPSYNPLIVSIVGFFQEHGQISQRCRPKSAEARQQAAAGKFSIVSFLAVHHFSSNANLRQASYLDVSTHRTTNPTMLLSPTLGTPMAGMDCITAWRTCTMPSMGSWVMEDTWGVCLTLPLIQSFGSIMRKILAFAILHRSLG